MTFELTDTTIDAADFRRAVLDWLQDPDTESSALPRDRTISGPLDLGGIECSKMLDLSGRRFEGALQLNDCQFSKSVNLSYCRIAGTVNFSDSRIDGSLYMLASEIGYREHFELEAVAAVRAWYNSVPVAQEIEALRLHQPATVTLLKEAMREVAGLIPASSAEGAAEATGWWNRRPAVVDRWLQEHCHDSAAFLGNLEVGGMCGLNGITVWGSLNGQGLRSRNLSLNRARIRGLLMLIDIETSGRVDMGGIVVEHACAMETARLQRNLVLRGARIEHSLNLFQVRIGGTLHGIGLACHELSLEGARIDGDVELMSATIAGYLEASSMQVDGGMNLDTGDHGRSTIRGWASFTGTRCGRDLSLRGVEILGSAEFINIRASQLRLLSSRGWPTRIRNDLTCSGAEIIGAIDLRGTSIAGDAHFADTQCGNLFMAPEFLRDSNGRWSLRPTQASNIHAVGLTVSSRTALIAARAGGHEAGKAARGIMDFRLATLGAVYAWSDSFIEEAGERAMHEGAADYELDLAPGPWQLTAAALWMDGSTATRVELDNARVTASADASGKTRGHVVLSDMTVKDELSWQNYGLPADQVGCCSIDATGLVCDGDVNLSGITTTIDLNQGGTLADALNFRDATIHGDLRLYQPGSNRESGNGNAKKPAFAQLSGRLRLDAATVGHLIVSGASFTVIEPARPAPRSLLKEIGQALSFNLFCRPEHADNSPAVVSLERASIRRLEIRDPLPRPVDLTRASVERWELPPADTETASAMSEDERVAEPYLRLLACASPFKRSNYAMIDRQLRDRGENAASDTIFRAMKMELLRRENRWLREVGGLLHLFIGFGTRWKALMFLLVALALTSVTLFTLPDGIEIRPDTRSALVEGGQDPGVMRWDPEQWSPSRRIGAATALTLRYHVPLISLPAFEGFRAGPGLPMTWATVMTALHWILLPLILTSLIPAIVRRRDEA